MISVLLRAYACPLVVAAGAPHVTGTYHVRERPPVLATAASRQAKHHTVYPGTLTVRGVIRDRLGEPWGLYKYALLQK